MSGDSDFSVVTYIYICIYSFVARARLFVATSVAVWHALYKLASSPGSASDGALQYRVLVLPILVADLGMRTSRSRGNDQGVAMIAGRTIPKAVVCSME